MDPVEWKACEPEQQKEFTHTFDKFAKELMEAQESFKTNIVLAPLDDQQKATLRDGGRTTDVPLIQRFQETFSKW